MEIYEGATLGANTFTSTQTMPALAFTQVAWSAIGSAATAGMQKDVSDAGVKGSTWRADGTRWKPVNGVATLASLDTTSSNIANSETIVFQYLMPAALLQLKDRLRLTFTMTKSGATDNGTVRIRIGTAGTTSDTQINSNAATVLGAAGRQIGVIADIRVESATTALLLGVSNGNPGYYSASTAGGADNAITIANVSNALYVNVSVLSSSTNDTVAIRDVQLQLIAPAN